MPKILLLLADAASRNLTEPGQAILRDFRVGYELRYGSPLIASSYVKDLLTVFKKAGGQLIIYLDSSSGQGVWEIAAIAELPVLLVSSFEVSQSVDLGSGPWPVASCGPGAAGMKQAVFFGLQLLGLQDEEIAQNLQRYRHSQAAQMIALDQQNRVDFHV